jgi:hypothetical protein
VLHKLLRKKLTVKEQLALCTKYGINNVCAVNVEFKHAIWLNIAQSIDMLVTFG